jgi:hypothetical protein
MRVNLLHLRHSHRTRAFPFLLLRTIQLRPRPSITVAQPRRRYMIMKLLVSLILGRGRSIDADVVPEDNEISFPDGAKITNLVSYCPFIVGKTYD